MMKSKLDDPHAPFGVDFPIVQVGGGARATNYDYAKGSVSRASSVISG
jgi:hypothetical protein